VVLANGTQVPSTDDLTFVAFVNGHDDVIHTENAYNSPLGFKGGYALHEGKGYWFVNFANFRSANNGQAYKVQFTTLQDNLQASLDGSVPSDYQQVPTRVTLQASQAPRIPTGVTVTRAHSGVNVTWNTVNGLTYKVYRCLLPSGANNGHSNGVFTKVAEGVTSYSDTTVTRENSAWFLVIAEGPNGNLSGHSEEGLLAAEIDPGMQLQKQIVKDLPKVQGSKKVH
jgi:hypothetical protein